MHLSNFLSTAVVILATLFQHTMAQIGPPGWQETGVYAIYNLATNTSMDLVNGNPNNGAAIAG